MKLLAIGVGDCGNRLAADFARLDAKARSERRAKIVTTAYAVNNNKKSLSEISRGKPKGFQTILMQASTSGVGNATQAGAQLMREEGNRVLAAMNLGDFYHSDAILFIAGAAGSLGSGGAPVMIQQLRDRHVGKPIFALVILPFESESKNPTCIYNTALCLKSIYQVADAVFLIDNELFKMQRGEASPNIIKEMNRDIVFLFYDLLCASEEIGTKYVGAKSLSVGDVLQTLKGWTAIGTGGIELQAPRFSIRANKNFQEKGMESIKIMEAMSSALSQLSIECKIEDVDKALYLISVPLKVANIEMTKALGNRLSDLTKTAEIRGGDFYGAINSAHVTLILSGIRYSETVKNYYDKAVSATRES